MNINVMRKGISWWQGWSLIVITLNSRRLAMLGLQSLLCGFDCNCVLRSALVFMMRRGLFSTTSLLQVLSQVCWVLPGFSADPLEDTPRLTILLAALISIDVYSPGRLSPISISTRTSSAGLLWQICDLALAFRSAIYLSPLVGSRLIASTFLPDLDSFLRLSGRAIFRTFLLWRSDHLPFRETSQRVIDLAGDLLKVCQCILHSILYLNDVFWCGHSRLIMNRITLGSCSALRLVLAKSSISCGVSGVGHC